MVERRQLTDEHCDLWKRGCALLQAMSEREYREGQSDRYYRFCDIDKALTWRLVSPASESLFSHHLDGPADAWTSREYQQYIEWPAAKAWRDALIAATDLVPHKFKYEDE